MAAGTTGALVAQGANSNGWLEGERTVVSRLAGVIIAGVDRFSILFAAAPSPVDQCGSYLEPSSHKLVVHRLRDQPVTST